MEAMGDSHHGSDMTLLYVERMGAEVPSREHGQGAVWCAGGIMVLG